MVEREKGPTGRTWSGANRALVTAIECFGLALSVSFSGVQPKQLAISAIKDLVLEGKQTCRDE